MAQRALVLAFYVVLPMLGAVAAAGVAIAAVQSALKQSDPTVAVAPRLLAAGGALLIFGGWMMAMVGGFCRELWAHLPEMVR